MKAFGANARLIDVAHGQTWHGSELEARIQTMEDELHTMPAGLLLLPAPWTIDTVCRYLAALRQHRPLALLDPQIGSDTLAELVERFEPAGLWQPGTTLPAPTDYRNAQSGWIKSTGAAAVHPDLALLLTTSGSTGAARMVRLSRQGVLANADAIVQALGINPEEVAPTSLPLHLGYGLSVLNSHLAAGATLVVTTHPVIGADFWTAFDTHRATSLAAVSHTYELLARLRWTPSSHPSLRTLTQSGSRMRPELIAHIAEDIGRVGGRFFLMYGQTEATARMAVLPARRVADKSASVGLAVPGGCLSIRDETGEETRQPGITGEVIYRGPSVMMGYADSATDLARGDDQGGVLHTGDIGRFDPDGYLYLEGRLKRMAKLFGLRINLDAVERLAAEAGVEGTSAAVSVDDEVIVLWCEGETGHSRLESIARHVAERLRVNRHGVIARSIERLPLLRNGKIDYRALIHAAANGEAPG
ncbi:AMP-binding protein [Paraburkholderia haematera]|uniref:2-succinylbenzoate--CoA ligase n=1 Tax=Paraburkholderia haematera TaxID=2793077 RepID=A0ABM8ST64_9BURK|nr:AMP-binding protein [Paraburkholderia haematera]CAE6831207.1 2-succinylbenzoate--CoA ligase [Paraburkholderia haematera]